MRVLFFGNHTVGVLALKALINKVDVLGVVAHPEDEEDGVRYESVYDFACTENIRAIRGKGKDEHVRAFLDNNKPDLIWVTDYRYLLPGNFLSIPKLGGVNLHPSLLPRFRGRAPVNWAIINGERQVGLTAHYLTSGMDDGDIIQQELCLIADNEDVGDALNKLMPIYYSLTSQVIQQFIEGTVTSYAQDESLATTYGSRKPEDGKVDWRQPAVGIRNLVRAVSAPYPGAYTDMGGTKVYIWKSELSQTPDFMRNSVPGTIIAVDGDAFIVKCGDLALKVTQYTADLNKGQKINVGMAFS